MIRQAWNLMMVALLLAGAGCATSSDVFPDVGTNIASPSAMALDVAANRLYLVNSNDKVLYDPTQGNFQVYDITNPLAPVLLSTTPTLSFSGQIYYDAVTKTAWTPNRYSANSQATTDLLYRIDVDEASAGFMGLSSTTLGLDSYAIQCCYPANRAWVTTSLEQLQYVDLGGSLTPGAITLTSTLDNGGQISNADSNDVVIRGNQAFVSLIYGGIIVVNLDEADVAGSVPVDYLIADIEAPVGLAIDGDTLYVAGAGQVGDNWIPYLVVLDVSALTPTTANTTTALLDKEDDGLLQAIVQVGNQAEDVLLTTQYAFVTNYQDDTVSVVSRATNAVVSTLTVGDEPFAMALYTTPGGVEQYVYVGNLSSNTISIIDIPTLTVVATYP